MRILTDWLGRRRAPQTHDLTPEQTQFIDEGRDAVPHELAVRHGHQNLLVTPEGTWAFYVLGGLDWDHIKPVVRRTAMTDATFRWADLIGHRIWLRGLPSPYPTKHLGERLWRDNPNHLPDSGIPGARTWAELIESLQVHTLALEARQFFCVLGVQISDIALAERDLPKVLGKQPIGESEGNVQLAAQDYRRITEAVRRPGFGAEPISPKALRWAMHASIGMGAPVPPALMTGPNRDWPSDSIPGFTTPVYATQAEYAPTTQLRVMRNSRQITQHVAVLHADQFEDRNLDRHDQLPWLAWTQTQPHPVHFLVTGTVIDGRDLKTAAELDRRRAKNIAEHHAEHGDDPPASILRGIQRARVVEDEVINSPREVACRFRGVAMLAVTGDTEEDTLTTAAELTVNAAREQGITLSHDYSQYAYYRAFTAGEPCPMSGHITQMPGYFLATAVPNVSPKAGDPTGFLLGNIAGSRDVAIFDPFGGARRNMSNVLAVGADPGGGKSALAAALLDWCASSGVRSIGYDPSGPWRALTEMPHLKNHSHLIPLASGRPGILVPHLMILDPRREDHPTEHDWRMALNEAAQERMELCIDTMRDLLPYSMVRGDQTGMVMGSIEEAVTHIGGDYGTDPWRIVDHLHNMSPTGKQIADRLRAASQLKAGSLVFPAQYADVNDAPGDALMRRAELTIITMEGLALPPRDQPDRSLWNRDAHASVPILNLGARFAMRTIYADRDPKCVMMDELGISTGGTSSFSAFALRASFDSRKWHALIGLLFQNPATLMTLDPQIGNLAGAAMIGRMDETAAQAALPLLRLDADSGYHSHIASLQTGEFMMRDWLGRVRKVRVDWDWWHQHLRDAVDTTAGGAQGYDEGLDMWAGAA